MTHEQIVAQKTLAYSRRIEAAMTSISPAEKQTLQAIIAAFRRAAGQIRTLGAVDVDPNAVQCGNDVATVLGNIADFSEQSNNPGVLIESFLRGLAGDPFGKTAELLEAQSALAQQLKQVHTEVDNTRAILSSRYGIEFPSL